MADGVTRVAVVTGSRAELGLLAPVMRAIHARPELELAIVAAGSHLVPPAESFRGVRAAAQELGIEVAAAAPMQIAGRTTRADDAEALGVGVSRLARIFGDLSPGWVVVLGDRIEAYAAASAASVGGWALAHLHGGDRAEGIADEAMRHAITKLAHLHLPATPTSAERIVRMGELVERVEVVGSPAIDGLSDIAAMADGPAAELGDPRCVLLMHPAGLSEADEREAARAACEAAHRVFGARVLCLEPNHDPGRDAVLAEVSQAAGRFGWAMRSHLERGVFVSLLKRLASGGGVLVGNSSAGLIECAAIGLGCVNVGPRQAGRERSENVVDAESEPPAIARAIEAARALSGRRFAHAYGDGRAGERAAAALARLGAPGAGFLRKRCVY